MPKVFNNQVFIDFLAQLRPDEQHHSITVHGILQQSLILI